MNVANHYSLALPSVTVRVTDRSIAISPSMPESTHTLIEPPDSSTESVLTVIATTASVSNYMYAIQSN